MAKITDCTNNCIKISKSSITIKSSSTDKTIGIVKDISTLYNIQPNKQMQFIKTLKSAGVKDTFPLNDYIIDMDSCTMYLFRNIKPKLYHNEHGYFSEEEKQKAEEKEILYDAHKKAGIQVIECIMI